MKETPKQALQDAMSLLQETAQSPFLTDEPGSKMADIDELFLVNLKMRQRNLDRWILLLQEEVERRAEAVRERRSRQTRTEQAAPNRLRASA